MLNVNETNKPNRVKTLIDGELSVLASITSSMKEGVDYINIFRGADSELGKALSPGFVKKFNTFLGTTLTMKSYMLALNTPGYPIEYVSKGNFRHRDVVKIPKKTIVVPNYWALVAHGLCQKVKADKQLQEMMIKNTLPYTCHETTTNKEFFNKSINVSVPKNSMGRYVAIVRVLDKMLKDGKFTDEEIEKFILSCKNYPNKDIFDGIACNVNIEQK